MIETCRNCGGPGHHVHHVIPKSICEAGRAEVRNLILLCVYCHGGWHDRDVIIYRDVFTDTELQWICEHASEGWLDRWYPERPYSDLVF